MVVDDLQNLRVLDAVHGLGLLVVVHHNHLLALQIQQVPSGNHAHVIVVLIHNREIPVALLAHDFPDILRLLIDIEDRQVVGLHKIFDGHALVDEPCRRKRIKRRADHHAAVLLGQLGDGHGDLRALADNDAAGVHLDGAELGFVPVAQNHQVAFLDIVLHQIRIGRRNQHLSLIIVILRRAHQNLSLQSVDDIAVLGVGLGQNLAVIHVHVGGGDVADGNQALQLPLLRDRQGHHAQSAHQVPGLLQGQISLHALGLADLDILHLGHHIRHIDGRFRLKEIQHILRLLVQLARSGRDVAAPLQMVFQIRIGKRRADGIRVRILVADDIHRSCHILLHCHPPVLCILP